MKKTIVLVPAIVLIVVLYQFLGNAFTITNTDPSVQLTVNPQAVIPIVHRGGINLGYRTEWGSEQLMKNIILNPGFEGTIDRRLIVVNQVDSSSFYDDKGWGDPDGWWAGATFEVRSGASLGAKGTIANSLQTGANGLPQYVSKTPLPALKPHDVIVVMQTKPDTNVWLPNNATNVVPDGSHARPGSSGVQSLKMTATKNAPAVARFFYDGGANETNGKFLLVNGPWTLSFWMTANNSSGKVDVTFKRINGQKPFFQQTIHTTSEWQQYTFNFTGNDDGAANILDLDITVSGTATVWLDDMFLGPAQASPTAFRTEVLDILKKIRPRFIRDTQGQLADSTANRLADPYSRKNTTMRMGENQTQTHYLWSIPELLELSKQVGAIPWIVLPTTLTDSELTAMGQFLAKNASRKQFSQVIVEFGNENWNWVFKPAGIPYPDAHGPVAERAFQLITAAAGTDVNLTKVINGQHVNPAVTLEYAKAVPNATITAVAPYYYYTQNAGTPTKKELASLFSPEGGLLKQTAEKLESLHQSLAVYELNMSTNKGTALDTERNLIVAGAVSGAALAKKMLENVYANAQPQVIYTFSGYQTRTSDVPGDVKLWGITRDLSPTQRLRPTGLALAMMNKVMGGSLHEINVNGTGSFTKDQGDHLTMGAFQTAHRWKAAVVSANDVPLQLAIQFPNDGRAMPNELLVLQSNSPFDNNEESEKVTIASQHLEVVGNTARFTVPAWGLVILNSTTPLPSAQENKTN